MYLSKVHVFMHISTKETKGKHRMRHKPYIEYNTRFHLTGHKSSGHDPQT